MAERGDISSSPEGNGSGTPGPALARRLLVAVVVATAGLSVLVAVSSTAAGGPPPRTVDRVESSKPGKAPPIVRELPDQRTATSTTYLTEDGSHVARVFPEPINYRASDGQFRPIDTELVESAGSGYALRTAANRLIAELPADASSPVRVEVGGDWARFSLQGANGGLRHKGKRARYPAALPATDLTYESVPEGLKETLILRDSRAPASFRFAIETSAGLQLRENEAGGIDFLDGRRTVFSFEAPFAYDADEDGHGPADVPAKPRATMRLVSGGADANVVQVDLDRAWLSDPDRAFPVTLDPTVSYIDASAKLGGATQDTALSQDTPTTSYSTAGVNDAGFGGLSPAHDHRALLKFDVAGAVPEDSVVFSSTLGMYLERQDTATLSYLRVREVARNWTNAATWNSYDGTNAWTTPGGDVTSYASAGIQPGIGFNYWKDLHSLAQRWVDRSSPNNGLLVERCCSSANNRYEFTSSEGAQSQWPYLQVWYTQRAGTSRAYSFWQPDGSVTQGNDGDTPGAKSVAPIGVNVATGNLLTRSTDREPDVPESQDVVRWHNSVWWDTAPTGAAPLATGSMSACGPSRRATCASTDRLTRRPCSFVEPTGLSIALSSPTLRSRGLRMAQGSTRSRCPRAVNATCSMTSTTGGPSATSTVPATSPPTTWLPTARASSPPTRRGGRPPSFATRSPPGGPSSSPRRFGHPRGAGATATTSTSTLRA